MRRLFPVLVLLAVGGCGGSGGNSTSVATTTRALTSLTFDLFLLRDGRVTPVEREVRTFKSPLAAAIDELARGPTPSERAAGLDTAMPHRFSYQVNEGPGTVEVTISPVPSRPALAQLTYTLSDLSSGSKVTIAGKKYTTADFRGQTPAILIESPSFGRSVHSPLRVSGTADTFEATFTLELRTGGRLLVRKTVRAASGSGTRGVFAATLRYSVGTATKGELRAYELSAQNGQPVNEVSVPISLLP